MEERERKTKVKGWKGKRGGGKDLAYPKILAWRPYARPLAGYKGPGASKGTPSDAKCVTEILGGGGRQK